MHVEKYHSHAQRLRQMVQNAVVKYEQRAEAHTRTRTHIRLSTPGAKVEEAERRAKMQEIEHLKKAVKPVRGTGIQARVHGFNMKHSAIYRKPREGLQAAKEKKERELAEMKRKQIEVGFTLPGFDWYPQIDMHLNGREPIKAAIRKEIKKKCLKELNGEKNKPGLKEKVEKLTSELLARNFEEEAKEVAKLGEPELDEEALLDIHTLLEYIQLVDPVYHLQKVKELARRRRFIRQLQAKFILRCKRQDEVGAASHRYEHIFETERLSTILARRVFFQTTPLRPRAVDTLQCAYCGVYFASTCVNRRTEKTGVAREEHGGLWVFLEEQLCSSCFEAEELINHVAPGCDMQGNSKLGQRVVNKGQAPQLKP